MCSIDITQFPVRSCSPGQQLCKVRNIAAAGNVGVWTAVCQVAENSAKKLKRGIKKYILVEEFWCPYGPQFWPKVAVLFVS